MGRREGVREIRDLISWSTAGKHWVEKKLWYKWNCAEKLYFTSHIIAIIVRVMVGFVKESERSKKNKNKKRKTAQIAAVSNEWLF